MKDIIYKLSFTIKVDHIGFYIDLENQTGHPIHTGYLQPYESDTIPIPSPLLREEEIEDMASAANAVCKNSVDHNFMEEKLKKFINSMCCDYLICKYNCKRKFSKDDISVMLADFQWSNEIKFTTLSNIPINEYLSTNEHSIFQKHSKKSVNISTSKNEFGIIANHPTSEDPNLIGLQELATNERHERKYI